MKQGKIQKYLFLKSAVAVLTVLPLTSCTTVTAKQYEAIATTSYSWQVKYANSLTNEPSRRLET